MRATESRSLSDGTPSPAYIAQWVAGIQLDLFSMDAVKVDPKHQLEVYGMNMGFLKHYRKHANSLADQCEYTITAHSYLMMLGKMEKDYFVDP